MRLLLLDADRQVLGSLPDALLTQGALTWPIDRAGIPATVTLDAEEGQSDLIWLTGPSHLAPGDTYTVTVTMTLEPW